MRGYGGDVVVERADAFAEAIRREIPEGADALSTQRSSASKPSPRSKTAESIFPFAAGGTKPDCAGPRPGFARRASACSIPRGASHDLCPVRALEDWLRAADLRYGPAFRKITRWGTVEPRALGEDAVRRVLARYSS